MFNSRYAVTDRVLARMGDTSNLQRVRIEDQAPVAKAAGLFRVLVAFTDRSLTPAQMGHQVAAAFNNDLSVVPRSFRQVHDPRQGYGGGPLRALGFVRANTVTMPYQTALASGMRFMTIARNVLMSESDESLWDVTDDGQITRRNTVDDMTAAVQVASGHRSGHRLASVASVRQTYNDIAYVAYASTRTNDLAHGFVLGELDDGDRMVVYSDDGVEDEIGNDQVIETASPSEGLKEIAAEIPSIGTLPMGQGAASLRAYYERLYAHAPEYMAMLNEEIDGRSLFD